ncbi:putative efflux pump antibiotic resistance protein [Thozetella sp. PMI_491]|nr:putative efflux pump antibiotic resistance protein [Thozetella sp. PMI_491]
MSVRLGEEDGDAELSQTSDERNREGPEQDDDIDYVHGARYWTIVVVIACMFFLTAIDTTIATTSLVAITDDIGGFEMASWVITSYLLGYGLAAGGCFALSSALLIESVPPEKYADAVTQNGVAIILALILGPILGGVISEHTTWRWIFLLNIPIGVFLAALALVGIPNEFPYQNRPEHWRRKGGFNTAWAKIDIPGTALVFLATLSFTACFQEADSRFAWNSAYVITLLVVSIALWVVLIIWERHVTLAGKTREPVLPWRFFTNRATHLADSTCHSGFVFVGASIYVTNFQLPQRFLLINGLSNFDAGIRIVPFGAAFAVGTILSGKLASKLKVPGLYLICIGGLLQVAGYALLGTLQASVEVQPGVYGYQVLAGIGCSFSYSNLIMLVAYTAEKGDGAVALAAANQFRAMGGAIGLAVVTSIFNGHVGSQLVRLGITTPVPELTTQSEASLTPQLRDDIRGILSGGYNQQMLVLCAIGAAQVPAALLMWKRDQKQVVVA